jgi:hypothetical protein
MVDLFKGWQKIYLLYGVLFFLLGLFGYLASDEVRLAAWSARQIQSISRIWSLNLLHEDEGQAIPAFTSRFGEVVLQVYRGKDTNRQFENLLQQLQSNLQKNFQRVITIPVAELNSVEFDNQSTPIVLVGFNQTSISKPEDTALRNNLYFGMPDQASYLLAGKLIQMISAQLPEFTFSKQVVGQITVFNLSWDSSSDSQLVNSKVFSAFLKIIAQDALKMIANKSMD